MTRRIVALGCLMLGLAVYWAAAEPSRPGASESKKGRSMERPTELEKATFAGGCFWCTEAVFEEVQGVYQVTSGYLGGHQPNPTYEQVCSGQTGHAEAVQIAFDPREVSYRDLLEIHFRTHDPTTLNRQGNDVGTQYRSAIFTHSEEQQATAEAVIAALEAERVYPQPIVTEVMPAPTWYPAEDYHQDYYARNPSQGYCAFVIAPKMEKFRKVFPERLRREPTGP